MDRNRCWPFRLVCTVLLISVVLACGGGSSTAGAGSTGSNSGGGTSSSFQPAPAAIYSVQHFFPGDFERKDEVPSVEGLAQGGGKFWFLNNGHLYSYEPASGTFRSEAFGPISGPLIFEGEPAIVSEYSVTTFVNGKMVLYDFSGQVGLPRLNVATSDGQGHIYFVGEGHGTMEQWPAVGGTLYQYDMTTHAVKVFPFRPWGPADDSRSSAFPYSGVVLDGTRKTAFVISYYYHEITRIDLVSGAVAHFLDSRINYPSDIAVDSKGNVYSNQPNELITLSSTGAFSSRNWPSGFSVQRYSGKPLHDMAVDDKDRLWVVSSNGSVACMPQIGEGTRYWALPGARSWDDPEGLIWDQGRLWVSSNVMGSTLTGSLFEIQIPPSGVSPLPGDPIITAQPISMQVGQYKLAHFAVQAYGNGTLTYQWKLNGSPIPFATANNYDVPFITGADVGSYSCLVTNSLYGQVKVTESVPATLTLIQDPAIATFTASSTRIRSGQSVSLTSWFTGGTGILSPGEIPVTSGVQVSVMPLTSTPYTLEVTNSLGVKATASLAINVDEPGQLISNFMAAPALVEFGQTTSLAWFTNTPLSSLSLRDDLGLLGPLDLTGNSVTIQTPIRRQTLVLTANAPGATGTATVQVAARGLDRLAGFPGGQGYLDGQGADARISFPWAMAVKADGTLIFAEQFAPVIRQVTPDGLVTTLCGRFDAQGDKDGAIDQARFSRIGGLIQAADGTLYILDSVDTSNPLITDIKLKRLDTSGQVSTIGVLGQDGSGTKVSMCFDAAGSLLVPLEMENKVIKVSPSGVVTPVAIGLVRPGAVALQPDGSLIVLSRMGYLNLIRTDGSVQEIHPTIAVGEPGEGTGTTPLGMTADSDGTLYLAGPLGVYRLDAGFGMHPLCQGSGSIYGTGYFENVVLAPQKFLWTARIGMGAEIVKIVPGQASDTVAGLIRPFHDVTSSPAPIDQFGVPCGLATGVGGSILMADSYQGTLRRITPAGGVTEVPLGTSIGGNWSSVWSDASGRIVYFCLSLSRYDPATQSSTSLINFSLEYTIRDGTIGEATNGDVRGIVGDHLGNIYFLDTISESDSSIAELYVRKITPDGSVVTLAGGPCGFKDGQGFSARFSSLRGIALDPAGNLIVVDQGNHSIRKVTPKGEVTTVAGGPDGGFADGLVSQARFSSPSGISVDPQGNIFVADTGNASIRMISPEGLVSTLLGNPLQPGSRIGTTGHARLQAPMDVLVNADGDLIVTDSGAVLQFTAPLGH